MNILSPPGIEVFANGLNKKNEQPGGLERLTDKFIKELNNGQLIPKRKQPPIYVPLPRNKQPVPSASLSQIQAVDFEPIKAEEPELLDVTAIKAKHIHEPPPLQPTLTPAISQKLMREEGIVLERNEPQTVTSEIDRLLIVLEKSLRTASIETGPIIAKNFDTLLAFREVLKKRRLNEREQLVLKDTISNVSAFVGSQLNTLVGEKYDEYQMSEESKIMPDLEGRSKYLDATVKDFEANHAKLLATDAVIRKDFTDTTAEYDKEMRIAQANQAKLPTLKKAASIATVKKDRDAALNAAEKHKYHVNQLSYQIADLEKEISRSDNIVAQLKSEKDVVDSKFKSFENRIKQREDVKKKKLIEEEEDLLVALGAMPRPRDIVAKDEKKDDEDEGDEDEDIVAEAIDPIGARLVALEKERPLAKVDWRDPRLAGVDKYYAFDDLVYWTLATQTKANKINQSNDHNTVSKAAEIVNNIIANRQDKRDATLAEIELANQIKQLTARTTASDVANTVGRMVKSAYTGVNVGQIFGIKKRHPV